MNWLLLIVLAIIIINALIGRKVGLIKIVFSLFSFIIALFLTTWISPSVNEMLINNESFYQKTNQKVEEVLFSKVEEDIAEAGDIEKLIASLPLPQTIKDSLQANKEKQETNIKSYITSQVTAIVINALAFVFTFIVIFIALWVISIALNIISKLPILNQINKIAGLFVGGLQGLVIVWILFVILTVISGSEIGQSAILQINNSKILTYIYDRNILLNTVMSISTIF
ncbi:MAG: CvpA family protein [Clostridiales bacterium]|nr:CvpA family protein [Clostridiales bacterium]